MARAVEIHGIESTHLGKPVEREVPGQCVRPFVAEHLDGLRLTKIAVELDHEPLIPLLLSSTDISVYELNDMQSPARGNHHMMLHSNDFAACDHRDSDALPP